MTKFVPAVIAFVLVGGPAFAQQSAPSAAATPAVAEKMICKRSAPSGSLIETRRECHSRTEWNRIAQDARASAQDVVDRGTGGARGQ